MLCVIRYYQTSLYYVISHDVLLQYIKDIRLHYSAVQYITAHYMTLYYIIVYYGILHYLYVYSMCIYIYVTIQLTHPHTHTYIYIYTYIYIHIIIYVCIYISLYPILYNRVTPRRNIVHTRPVSLSQQVSESAIRQQAQTLGGFYTQHLNLGWTHVCDNWIRLVQW